MQITRLAQNLSASVLALLPALTLLPAPAAGSDIGQLIADQIDVVSYRHYLDDVLYTHTGDNRGRFGAQRTLARDAIFAELQSFGLEVVRQPVPDAPYPCENVIGTQSGTVDASVQFIISGHFDSVGNPGADDDASGVAAMLEIARVLSQYETHYTIKYIGFDLEEQGLVGSEYYVQQYWGDDIHGMISLDMIAFNGGTGTTRIIGGGYPASTAWKSALAQAVTEYGQGLVPEVRNQLVGSDHVPFEWAGYPACVMNEDGFASNPCYHRTCDTVDTPGYIDYAYAVRQARSVAGLLADVAVVILPPCPGDLDGDRVVDFDDLVIVMGSYGVDSGGDVDGDGDTDFADLVELLAYYGLTCQ